MRQAGELVAGFRIERLLGTGGMGEVYLVRHPRLPRLDALKLLPSSASADPTYRERFQREADLAAALDHDNVVTVYDRGESDGQLWIHMKYVAGADAAAALRESGPFDVRRVLHTITRVAAALDDAHRHGLLHRDVKPANILLGTPAVPGEPERVFLTDFGIAKGVGEAAGLTPNGHFAASLDYAAPEQIQLGTLDGRTDQYALGCVVFQLLTGSVPYSGDGAWAKMNAHLTSPVPKVGTFRPGLPSAVQTVLDRAMAKDPADRFASCGAMAIALGEALRGVGVAPVSSSVPPADAFPAPRPPDRSETPPPQPVVASAAPPLSLEKQPAPTAALPQPEPEPESQPQPQPPAVPPPLPGLLPAWWKTVDRAAGGCVAAAVVLSLLSLFPPSAAPAASRYPAALATGRFAAGQLPALLLLLAAAGMQLTRAGHRHRPLLCAAAAGAGLFAAVDSWRVYAFASTGPGGGYHSAISHTNGALPRALVGLAVALVALTGVRHVPPRPKPRPSSPALLALLLAAVAVVLTAVAVAAGPKLEASRLGAVAYGVPMAPTFVAAAILALAVWTRRVPLLATSATVALSAIIAGLVGPDQVDYPLATVADLTLLAGVGAVALAARRPVTPPAPPPPPSAPPPVAPAAQPYPGMLWRQPPPSWTPPPHPPAVHRR